MGTTPLILRGDDDSFLGSGLTLRGPGGDSHFGRVYLQMSANLSGTFGLQAVESMLTMVKKVDLWTDAPDEGGANRVYSSHSTIADGGTLSIDVQGALTDALSEPFVPVKVKVLYIGSAAANSTALTLLGDAASLPVLNTPATACVLCPGGIFLLVAPDALGVRATPVTGDIVKIVNGSGASAVVDVVIMGA